MKRRTRVARLAIFAIGVSGVFACATPKVAEQAPPTVEVPLTSQVVPTEVFAETDLAVVVTKHARRLELYRRGTLVQAFPIVLGARPMGAKRFEGDMRTPEGVYRVAAKRLHGRWRYFIAIDYPTEEDRSAYDADLNAGRIPQIGGKNPGLGGNLGIHGNDRPRDQASGKDWTRGCVAMRNEDVAVLYDVVDVGTPVIVLP